MLWNFLQLEVRMREIWDRFDQFVIQFNVKCEVSFEIFWNLDWQSRYVWSGLDSCFILPLSVIRVWTFGFRSSIQVVWRSKRTNHVRGHTRDDRWQEKNKPCTRTNEKDDWKKSKTRNRENGHPDYRQLKEEEELR